MTWAWLSVKYSWRALSNACSFPLALRDRSLWCLRESPRGGGSFLKGRETVTRPSLSVVVLLKISTVRSSSSVSVGASGTCSRDQRRERSSCRVET